MKRSVLNVLNFAIQPMGLALTPNWQVQWWTAAQSFKFAGEVIPCFYHLYNCGWPPYTSERCVELAIADNWLKRFGPNEVIEVGAVTPYYWPHRVATVVDPFDEHPLVTHRQSFLDLKLDRPILSISTFEHIGMGDYGSSEPSEAVNVAFERLFEDAEQFLVTVPIGYNRRVDELLFERSLPKNVTVEFLTRDRNGGWQNEPALLARRQYGDNSLQRRFPGSAIGKWANSIAILTR